MHACGIQKSAGLEPTEHGCDQRASCHPCIRSAAQLSHYSPLWACLHAPVALVSSLRETSVIFAMFLGVILLGEQITRTRIVITIVMVIGVFMTRLF